MSLDSKPSISLADKQLNGNLRSEIKSYAKSSAFRQLRTARKVIKTRDFKSCRTHTYGTKICNLPIITSFPIARGVRGSRGCTPSETSDIRFAISKLSANSAHSLRPLCLTSFISCPCALFGPLVRRMSDPTCLFSISSALFCKHRGWGSLTTRQDSNLIQPFKNEPRFHTGVTIALDRMPGPGESRQASSEASRT
jgi:hypothetical protein